MRWENCRVRRQHLNDIDREFTSGDYDLDAYIKSIDFYLKNGFYLINKDIDYNKHTVTMYFDLTELAI